MCKRTFASKTSARHDVRSEPATRQDGSRLLRIDVSYSPALLKTSDNELTAPFRGCSIRHRLQRVCHAIDCMQRLIPAEFALLRTASRRWRSDR